MEMARLTLNLPADQAERIARAVERAACAETSECAAEEYRKRIFAAFCRYCPDRKYTGTALDFDTLIAVLEVRLAAIPHRRAGDPPETPFTPGL